MADEGWLRELRAEREIQRAMLTYFRGSDRLDLELMSTAYHDDAYDDHGSYKGGLPGLVAWIRKRHEVIDQSMHLSATPFVTFEGRSTAHVETYCILVQHERSNSISLATGKVAYRRCVFGVRYVDLFEERSGAWKIARRKVVWEWAEEDLGDLTMPDTWIRAQRSRSDAVFASSEPPDNRP